MLASKVDLGGGFQYSRSVLDALLSDLARSNGLQVQVTALHAAWLQGVSDRVTLPPVLVKVPRSVQKMRSICIRLNWLSFWNHLRARISPLTRHLQSSSPDLVISPCQSFLCLDSPRPVIAPIHDLMYIYEPTFPEVAGTYAKRRRSVDKAVTSRCAGILVDSRTGADHVAEQFGYPRGKLHILPFCVHRPSAEVLPEPTFVVPKHYLFYPAQLWSHKNHIVILQALALLKTSGLIVHCVFCGSDKNSGNTMRASIVRLGLADQVTLLGLVSDDDLNWLYRHALALVMPTYFGPTNIPPLEAMSSACPVLASDIYAVREQLGDAASYFPPSDPASLAQLIQGLCADGTLRQDLVTKGRQRLPKFSHERFTERLVEIVNTFAVQASLPRR